MKFKYRFILLLSLIFLTHNVFSLDHLNLVSVEKLQEKIKAVNDANNLDEASKNKLLDSYAKTSDYLELIKTSDKNRKVYNSSRINSPKKIKLLEEKFKKLDKDSDAEKVQSDDVILKTIKKISLSELEQQLASDSIKLTSVASKNSDLSLSHTNESQSLAEIRKNIITANTILEKKLEEKQLIPENSSAEQKQARQWRIDAQISSLRSQIKMWDEQLLSLPIRLQLLKIEKKISDQELNMIQSRFDLLQRKVDLKRDIELEKTQAAIRKEQIKAEGKHLLIQSLAQSNTLLSEQLSSKSKALSEYEFRDDETYKAIKKLSHQQANTKKKLEIAGLNQILGQMLFEQKKSLPDRKQFKNNIKQRQKLIAQSGLENLQHQDELEKVKHKKEYINHLLSAISPEVQAEIYDDVMELINTRQKLLEKAITIDEKYFKAIGEVDFAEIQYFKAVNTYSDLLDEHLFWLRSAPVLNLQILRNIPQQVTFFLAPSKWLDFVNEFITMVSTSFYILPGLLFFGFILFKKNHLNKLLINIGLKTRRISKDSLLHTFKAIFYTLLLAAPIPILLFIVGWQLSMLSDVSDFTFSIALGMQYISLPLFWLQTFHYMCLPGGLADIHFKWSATLISGLRYELRRLMITFLPIIFIAKILIYEVESTVSGGLVRIALILILITFTIFFYRLVKPKTGILHSIAGKNPDSYFVQYQTLWFITGLIIIFVLFGLIFGGYVYTAAQLIISLLYTAWLIFVIVILQQISVRWLLLTQRRYALNIAYEKRIEIAKKKSMDDNQQHDMPEHAMDIDEPEIDIVSLSEESIKLLNMVLFILGIVGLSAIWSGVLPALGFFEQFVLWHHTGLIDGVETIVPVTLWDLILALLIMVLTIVSAKRLPAIIEILLLQSASVSSGSRYTITTLVNYIIIGFGFFTIFKMLGAEWDKLQWLFAALSVGIGFGLQEIVANFISGIIILFERPIRVGDYVSVGDNEGVVSKIQIRATTILTRDRKELLVPNKEFITGQLLNWSLSDPTTRLILPVGVAYGSDIPLARKLLLEAAEENEQVLKEPNPQVLFFNFGDNSLDLQLRCFIDDVNARLKISSQINEAINMKFNAAHINIPFPQRDVHLDIKQPMDIVLNKKDT